MSKLPKVLIVGRPNVGKSTFVNRIIKKKKAIIYDEPGVTRDISTHEVVYKGMPFVLMDSGGVMFSKAKDMSFQQEIDDMVSQEIDRADFILFLVDSRDGLHPLDSVIGKRLQSVKKKVSVVVNKIDNPDLNASEISPFYRLGLGEPFGVSSHHGRGIPELLAYVTSDFKQVYGEEETETPVEYRVSFVGRPNVGKSSLVNALINDKRMIVSEIAGTTRDAVDVYFNYHKKKYIFTDTAGLRRRTKVDDGVEFYSTTRTTRAIRESDIVIMLLDAEEGMSKQDKKIIDQILLHNKPMMVFVNKWDLTERTSEAQKTLEDEFIHQLPPLVNFPLIFGSAKDRLNIGSLFDKIPTILETAEKRIQTADLNRFVVQVVKRSPPPSKYGKTVKVYYGSQVGVSPPEFIFFVNNAGFVGEDYIRFVENRIRQHFGGYEGTPLVVKFKARERREFMNPQKHPKFKGKHLAAHQAPWKTNKDDQGE